MASSELNTSTRAEESPKITFKIFNHACARANSRRDLELCSPKAIINSNTSTYVADYGNDRVLVFDSKGIFRFKFGNEQFGTKKMNGPFGICISDDYIYVTQFWDHCINVYDLKGRLVNKEGKKGKRNLEFCFPQNILISTHGNSSEIYICDSLNSRIQILDANLNYMAQFGNKTLSNPRDIKLFDDNIYVLDWTVCCLHQFNSNHHLVRSFISNDEFGHIDAYFFIITIGGSVILSCNNINSILQFTLKGKQKENKDIIKSTEPMGITLTNRGELLVVSTIKSQINITKL